MTQTESSMKPSGVTSNASTGLLKKTSIVALMTLLSRLLGFARDIFFASLFGAGGALDAFVIAFKIPNFFRRLFGEGAFSQAFVPILSQLRAKESEETVYDFACRVYGCLSLVLVLLVAVFEVLSPVVITVFAPGFLHDPDRYQLASSLLRWTIPYIFLISLTAMSAGILNTYQRFALPAFAPVLLNVAFIGCSLWWAPHTQQPIMVLGYAVIIGGVLQLLIQLPALAKINMLPKFKWGFSDPQVKRVLKLMVPALFGVSVAQISLLVDNWFASFLPAGSISWLYYSDRMTYLPLGVFGVAIATVVLPNLSKQFDDAKQYSKTLDWALRSVLFVGVPSAVGLMLLSKLILTVLFMHGAFTAYDVNMTTHSLLAFAFGLPAFMLIKVLASAFYSRQNIKTPVKVAAWSLLLNLIGNCVLIHWLAHAGLALSSSIAAYFNAILLYLLLWRNQFYTPGLGWGRYAFRLGLSTLFMAAAVALAQYYCGEYVRIALWLRALLLLGLIGCGGAVYFIVNTLMGWRWQELK